MVQVYRLRLHNQYLGDKIIAIPAKDELSARAIAVRLNSGYTVAECEVYNENGRAAEQAPGAGIEDENIFGDE